MYDTTNYQLIDTLEGTQVTLDGVQVIDREIGGKVMLQSVKSEDSERLWYSSGNILYVAQIQYVTDPIFGNESHEITDWVLQKFTDDIESNLQMRNGILSYMSSTPTSTDLASLESDSNTKNFQYLLVQEKSETLCTVVLLNIL